MSFFSKIAKGCIMHICHEPKSRGVNCVHWVISRSVNIRGCSKLLGHSQLQITQGYNAGFYPSFITIQMIKLLSMRDIGNPNPRKSTFISILAIDTQHVRSSKSDIRDV
ncbi:hypothetical protein HanXRQr2_Chr03g0112241 [Helianthus annuus]|uniref:Uncharacterized protein n=1 Tax=Helianthus annuus TaxID=4232 RepID=A0A251UZN2_HELAN|nr:hypothetical protein HanXRQr2_Chr03g0112241 [Helianthus annuus]KAJ0943765.1 hypothetical protein HanPSC8_Chr03g0108551 [Helianthus annuus]